MEQREHTAMSCLLPFTFSPAIPAMHPFSSYKKCPRSTVSSWVLLLKCFLRASVFSGSNHFNLLLSVGLFDFYLVHHQSPQNVAAKIHSFPHCSFSSPPYLLLFGSNSSSWFSLLRTAQRHSCCLYLSASIFLYHHCHTLYLIKLLLTSFATIFHAAGCARIITLNS